MALKNGSLAMVAVVVVVIIAIAILSCIFACVRRRIANANATPLPLPMPMVEMTTPRERRVRKAECSHLSSPLVLPHFYPIYFGFSSILMCQLPIYLSMHLFLDCLVMKKHLDM